jgi:RimJ/RimL family protein N-acetyltransferase
MRLRSVYDCGAYGVAFLYDLLKERTPEQSISHKELPLWYDHRRFVENKPYLRWYLIEVDHAFVGSIYLSKQSEVGLFILKAHQGKSYGRTALKMLREKHPGRLLVNIAFNNLKSVAFFHREGFTPLQLTFEANDAEPH